MALLSRIRTAAARGPLLLILALALLGSCALIDALRSEDEGLTFNHQVHVVEEGLECIDCHAGVEDSEEPGMPVLGQCMLCHEDIDAEKPPERQIAQLFDDQVYRAKWLSRLEDEVVFSHQGHVAAVDDCAACHGPVGETTRIEPEVALDMDGCMSCHAQRSAPNDCATCHTVIREDVAPKSHEGQWERFHGSVVRSASQLAARCSLCHSESSCLDCHRNTPPATHDNFFRQRGHGFVARLDRQRCATCHSDDSCQQCHAEVLPLSHHGGFGSPMNRHCVSCHFPLKAEGCFVCHQGTPSHALAAPMPPWHNPGMDCRQCHGVTQPLPHPDKGDECIICHR